MTSPTEKASIITTAIRSPKSDPPPGAPIMTVTPTSASAIATHILGAQRSPRKAQARTGNDRRGRLDEEDVRDRRVVQRDDERARGGRCACGEGEPPTADPAARPDQRSSLDECDVGGERDHREERAARDLGRGVHLEEALERPGCRPGERGRHDGDLPPAAGVHVPGRRRAPAPGSREAGGVRHERFAKAATAPRPTRMLPEASLLPRAWWRSQPASEPAAIA